MIESVVATAARDSAKLKAVVHWKGGEETTVEAPKGKSGIHRYVTGARAGVFGNLTATKSLEAIYLVHKNLRPDGSVNNVPDKFIANFEPAENFRGHFIKLSVAPSAKNYKVSIPAHGHERTFQTR